MKVLYVVWGFPKISETYITNEIRFMRRQGVEIEVWSPLVGTVGMNPVVPVHRGHFFDALKTVKPNLVHVHYLAPYHDALEVCTEEEIPVTVRGHSFDWHPANFKRVADFPCVLRVYLFPHFAAQVVSEKAVPLTVAFDPDLFKTDRWKMRQMVLRTGAAKESKGLEDFILTAPKCPGHHFTLVANVVHGRDGYMRKLRELCREKTFFYENASNDEAAHLTRMAGIYMDTNNPKEQPFGMPVSIVEALGAGCYTLVRRSKVAEGMLGGAGAMYDTVDEAASLINATMDWDDAKWGAAREAAVKRSRAFHDTAVLPKILNDWKVLVG